jgi:glycosyltransferase involved in cell wall biosynthesis
MKVCFVTTSFIRSAEDHYARFVYEQAKSLRLADESVSVVVVAPHAPGLAAEEWIDGLKVERAKYFRPIGLQRLAYQHEGLFETLQHSRLAALQLPLLLAAMLLRLVTGSKHAQVIHAQWVPTAAVALVVGWWRRIPVVVSVRGADLNTSRRSRMGRLLTRGIISRVNYVVTVSDEFRDLLVSELGCPTPVAAVYNGVDTEQFHPRDKEACRRELDLQPGQPMALYVGGLIKRKGVNILLQALAHEAMSACPVDLYLAGEGPQLEALQAEASAIGLAGRIHFLGKVPKDRMHLWMGAADVLVLPSYSEGRPNVVLEAMASGTPVVATAVNGTTELISDGADGLLFEPGDIAGLAGCLSRVLHEPGLAAKLSVRGPETIRTRGLTWLAHGRQLLSIYHQVLDAR